jgi:hypothetical protein
LSQPFFSVKDSNQLSSWLIFRFRIGTESNRNSARRSLHKHPS